MSEIQSEEGINESVRDETSSIGKSSPTKSKNLQASYEPSKFMVSTQNNQKSQGVLSGKLKNAVDSRRSFDVKFSNVYNKVEMLKKEYDHEVGRINGLRNKSLYLYKLKRDADAWVKKRNEFLEKTKNQENSHKLNSKNNKARQEILNSQIKKELLMEKQKNVQTMKEKKEQLTQEFLRNFSEDQQKRFNLHKKISELHHIQEIKKQKLQEQKMEDLSKIINKKIEEEGQKKSNRMQSIEDLQKEEYDLLRKIRGCHKIHEMALLEYADLKNKPLNKYEKKYKKPIKLDPL